MQTTCETKRVKCVCVCVLLCAHFARGHSQTSSLGEIVEKKREGGIIVNIEEDKSNGSSNRRLIADKELQEQKPHRWRQNDKRERENGSETIGEEKGTYQSEEESKHNLQMYECN